MMLRRTTAAACIALLLTSCGGGGSDSGGGSSPAPSTPATPQSLYAQPALDALSAADVERVVAQAAEEAQARGLPAVIAVTDRVGNVLAVFSMNGARATALTRPGKTGNLDAEGVTVPAAAAAIAKAITGAYLSSAGNAFSTRTASMIVQEHFPPSPATPGLESGPLFGVQFSQLPCSDLSRRFVAGGGAGAPIGPKRSPLGLSADPGGFPLYKNGVVVGGIGVMADGDYGFDANVLDTDNDAEEFIALAGTAGFDAPEAIRANRITVDGTSLRYSDATTAGLKSTPASARAFTSVAATLGSLSAVTGYYAGGSVVPGQAFGAEGSGIRKATSAEFDNADAYVLTDGSGTNRYPIRSGTDAATVASPLTQAEARAILEEAFKVMSRSRGQIRVPLDSRAQMSLSLVDTSGAILGIVRAPDAPVFGIDVSLQKARTAAFFANANAGAELSAVTTAAGAPDANVRDFVTRTRDFFGDPAALTGKVAFGTRSIGNIARPHFPDGEVSRPNGPLSRPLAQFSPFSNGLQSALIIQNLAQHLTYVASGGAAADTPQRCTFLPDAAAGQNRLQNGIQIFPGAVPIYRGNVLVGAIGISGDGIDQDDMAAFLGTHNAGLRVGIGNAPTAIRADQVTIPVGGSPVRLRYVSCPFAPFLDANDQNVCQGK